MRSTPRRPWFVALSLLAGVALTILTATNAAAQQSVLRLGTESGINLNLLFPITSNSRTYYYLDANGNGNDTGDIITHDALDTLLNGSTSADTTATQEGSHSGNNDARSVIIGDYTLVLPTTSELGSARTSSHTNLPKWRTTSANDFHVANRNQSEIHYLLRFSSGLAVPTADSALGKTAFQVIVRSPDSPSAPTGVTIRPEMDSLVVSWTPTPQRHNGGAAITGYTATASATSQSTRTCTATNADVDVATNTITCTITNLQNVEYTVHVDATNGNGTARSTPALATPIVLTIPAGPADLAAVPGPGSIIVSWTPVPDGSNGNTIITEYRAAATFSGVAPVFCTATGATADTCTILGLVPGRSYRVSIQAVNSIGTSAVVEGTHTVTGIVPSAAVVPDTPTGVGWLPGDGQITATWFALTAADNGGAPVLSYTATVTNRDDTNLTAMCTATDAEATSCDITGLTNGGNGYLLEVIATTSAGDSPPTKPAVGVVPGRPSPPYGLQLSPGNGSITAYWLAPLSNNGATVTSYQASSDVSATEAGRTMTDGGVKTRCTVTTPANAPATTCTITGLANEVEHRVTVRAFNSHGGSVASSGVFATPKEFAVPMVPMPAPATGPSSASAESPALLWTSASRSR